MFSLCRIQNHNNRFDVAPILELSAQESGEEEVLTTEIEPSGATQIYEQLSFIAQEHKAWSLIDHIMQ